MAIVKPVWVPRSSDPNELRKWYNAIVERLSYQTYAGAPSGNVTPRWVGDMCLNTSAHTWYKSYGTGNTEWASL